MSEQTKDSLFKRQKSTRPKIEEAAGDVLCGETLKNAIDFIAYLRANKMSPGWASANSWAVSYKNSRVCYIRLSGTQQYHNLGDNSWHVSLNGEYDSGGDISVGDKEIAWANIKHCLNCSVCAPGKNVTVFGKVFDKVCKHSYIVMHNPNAEALECAKELIKIRKNAISNLK